MTSMCARKGLVHFGTTSVARITGRDLLKRCARVPIGCMGVTRTHYASLLFALVEHILEHNLRAQSDEPPCSIEALAAHANFAVQAIWMELQDLVHAVDEMTTKTPQEAQ